jgi:hypothetical protein
VGTVHTERGAAAGGETGGRRRSTGVRGTHRAARVRFCWCQEASTDPPHRPRPPNGPAQRAGKRRSQTAGRRSCTVRRALRSRSGRAPRRLRGPRQAPAGSQWIGECAPARGAAGRSASSWGKFSLFVAVFARARELAGAIQICSALSPHQTERPSAIPALGPTLLFWRRPEPRLEPRRSRAGAAPEPRRSRAGAAPEPRRSRAGAAPEPRRSRPRRRAIEKSKMVNFANFVNFAPADFSLLFIPSRLLPKQYSTPSLVDTPPVNYWEAWKEEMLRSAYGVRRPHPSPTSRGPLSTRCARHTCSRRRISHAMNSTIPCADRASLFFLLPLLSTPCTGTISTRNSNNDDDARYRAQGRDDDDARD